MAEILSVGPIHMGSDWERSVFGFFRRKVSVNELNGGAMLYVLEWVEGVNNKGEIRDGKEILMIAPDNGGVEILLGRYNQMIYEREVCVRSLVRLFINEEEETISFYRAEDKKDEPSLVVWKDRTFKAREIVTGWSFHPRKTHHVLGDVLVSSE